MTDIKCSTCGKTKKADDYYSSNSYFMKATGRVNTCKQCLWDYVIPDDKVDYDIKKVQSTLRSMDKPYITSLWIAAFEESSSKGFKSDVFKLYMRNLAMKDFRNLDWSNSEFENDPSPYTEDDVNIENITIDLLEFDPNRLKELKRQWGNSFNTEDYIFLENFYGEYKNNFPTDTPAQVNIYKNLAKIHLQAEKELEKGNVKLYKDLMDLSSKMHTDGNIKPMQSSGMNDDKGVSTYGLWIKTIENDEPCEFFKDKPLYQDYDSLKKYIDKWFVRPLKNIFNISKDFDVKDD